MLYLAYALSTIPDTRVSIVTGCAEIKKEYLASLFGLDLSSVNFIVIRESASELERLSETVDIFIALSNFKPIKANSKHFIQALQVPYPPITISTVLNKIVRGQFKEGAKDVLRLRLINNAKRIATFTLSNSKFTHDVLLENFGLESKILYPPVADHLLVNVRKEKIILSVGRFFKGLYNNKRYDILCAAYRKIAHQLPGWEYHIVGSASNDHSTVKYIETLKKENQGFPIFFHINESRENLLQLYNRATIYWHGAGYGVNEKKFPEQTEHFGMSVAEAMTARCIPIVVDRGGLKEIVNMGVNGFLWSEISDLIDQTLYIAKMDSGQLNALQDSSRRILNRFGVETFTDAVRDLFLPLIKKSEK
ncbi:MAG: glycosyltransferase [Candidatus Kryptoniota bacterium]